MSNAPRTVRDEAKPLLAACPIIGKGVVSPEGLEAAADALKALLDEAFKAQPECPSTREQLAAQFHSALDYFFARAARAALEAAGIVVADEVVEGESQ